MAVSRTTITRPGNTTAYTAGDVVGGPIQLQGGFAGPESWITSCDLELGISVIPSGMTSFRAYFYGDQPPSAITDNSAWDFPSGDRGYLLGYVDLGSPADLGGTCYCQVDQVNRHMKLPDGKTWVYLVTNGAFTPAAGSETYTLTIRTASVTG